MIKKKLPYGGYNSEHHKKTKIYISKLIPNKMGYACILYQN